MNYSSMLEKNLSKLDKLNSRATELQRQVLEHPSDYQAVIALQTTKSEILNFTQKVSVLKYQAEIQKYKNE